MYKRQALISASNTSASLIFKFGQGWTDGISDSGVLSDYYVYKPITLAGTSKFYTQLGSSGDTNTYVDAATGVKNKVLSLTSIQIPKLTTAQISAA